MSCITVVTPLVSSALLSSVRQTRIYTNYSTWKSDESKVEETKGVVTTVDEVINRNFQSAISRLKLSVESCRLDKSDYF